MSEKRKNLGLSLDAVEKEIKVRKKYLEAIEKNDYSFLPESTTVKGFIRNYALILGLLPENILAIFRRDFEEDESGKVVGRNFNTVSEEKGFRWTPKATFFSIVFLILTFFSFFFIEQYVKFSSAPSLLIFSPKEGQVWDNKVGVEGKTDKDATVKIDGSLVDVSEDGNFKEEIVLPRGENVLTIEAANRQGKKRTINLKVKVE